MTTLELCLLTQYAGDVNYDEATDSILISDVVNPLHPEADYAILSFKDGDITYFKREDEGDDTQLGCYNVTLMFNRKS